MDATGHFMLSEKQAGDASAAAATAHAFVESQGFPLGAAMISHAWTDGRSAEVIEQLSRYQSDDGGFGRGLEVDIGSPTSNPFAARLAMNILLGLRDRPATNLESRLSQWLVANQHEDGDWRFSEETKSGDLAPWFAGWTFPSLNPSCCIAGLANRLGLSTTQMLARVASLFAEKASLDEARTGEFYDLLPYAEYAGSVAFPERHRFLDAIGYNIVITERNRKYDDAAHFWEHVLGGCPELGSRIPQRVLDRQATRLISEQAEDGGWPTPYNVAWRPIVTATNCVTLSRLRAGF